MILRAELHVQDCVSEIIKHARQSNVPIVVDGVCNQTSVHDSSFLLSATGIYHGIYL